MGEVRAHVLWCQPLMHQGNLLSYLSLETEVGSLLVPAGDGGGDVVHSLDSLHDSNGDSSQEIGDEGGGVFDFVVFSANNV